MEFKDAFKLVYGIHHQSGDRNGWQNHRERLQKDIHKYKTFDEWDSKKNGRTDLSNDEKWDLEGFDASIEVLFKLINDTPERDVGQ